MDTTNYIYQYLSVSIMCIYLIEENKSNTFPYVLWATMLMDGPQEHNNQSTGYILKLKLYRCHVSPHINFIHARVGFSPPTPQRYYVTCLIKFAASHFVTYFLEKYVHIASVTG